MQNNKWIRDLAETYRNMLWERLLTEYRAAPPSAQESGSTVTTRQWVEDAKRGPRQPNGMPPQTIPDLKPGTPGTITHTGFGETTPQVYFIPRSQEELQRELINKKMDDRKKNLNKN